MLTAEVEVEELSVVMELQPVVVVQEESAIQRSAELRGGRSARERESGEEEGAYPVSRMVLMYCGGTPTPTVA